MEIQETQKIQETLKTLETQKTQEALKTLLDVSVMGRLQGARANAGQATRARSSATWTTPLGTDAETRSGAAGERATGLTGPVGT